MPYYYDEAQQYFARKDKEQIEIMNSMSVAIQNSCNETLVVDTKVNAKQNIKLINPMDWWQEDES